MSDNIHMDEILKRNSIIRTRLNNYYSWAATTVISTYGKFFEVRLVEQYLFWNLMIGDKLACKYISGDIVYLFEAEIFNIKTADKSMVMKTDHINTAKNFRKHKRYDVSLPASFSREKDIGETYCIVNNIGSKGLGILSRDELMVDEKINVSIYLSGFDYIMLQCVVKWSRKENVNNIYGLAITGMDEIARQKYRKLIKKLSRKEMNLRKKGDKMTNFLPF